MDKIASIKSQIEEGLSKSEPGSGAYVYYEMKSGILATLVASILRDAAPNEEELKFYSLSYYLNDLKKKGVNDAKLEARVNELRTKFAKGPTTRLFS